MPTYALATIPLIRKLKENVKDINQVWYADDASGSGKINRLRERWDHINTLGPKFVHPSFCDRQRVNSVHAMGIVINDQELPFVASKHSR